MILTIKTIAPPFFVLSETHTLATHTDRLRTFESSKSESLSYWVSHNSMRQCLIKKPPPQPLQPPPFPSSHSSTPAYLLSPTPPVTQQLRPPNPFWKETTEQKITSPPLSHTPSLSFVFSSGLQLTPWNAIFSELSCSLISLHNIHHLSSLANSPSSNTLCMFPLLNLLNRWDIIA